LLLKGTHTHDDGWVKVEKGAAGTTTKRDATDKENECTTLAGAPQDNTLSPPNDGVAPELVPGAVAAELVPAVAGKAKKSWVRLGTNLCGTIDDDTIKKHLGKCLDGDLIQKRQGYLRARDNAWVQCFTCENIAHGCPFQARATTCMSTQTTFFEVCEEHKHDGLAVEMDAGLTKSPRIWAFQTLAGSQREVAQQKQKKKSDATR